MRRLPVAPDGTAHATTIAFPTDAGPRAVLICGPSGSGKSALGLALLGLGGDLVADDRTVVRRRGDAVDADAPAAIRGLIEARGVGLLRAHSVGPVQIGLVVDLAQSETARLPPSRRILVDEVAFPCLFRIAAPYFAVAVRQHLRFGPVPQET
jgi:HPr kinase/phosphorylase